MEIIGIIVFAIVLFTIYILAGFILKLCLCKSCPHKKECDAAIEEGEELPCEKMSRQYPFNNNIDTW